MVALFGSLLTNGICAAEFSAKVGLVSDYRLHGISQTAGDPSARLYGNVFFENGVFAEVFVSNVDFEPFGDANYEIDYLIGHTRSINENWRFTGLILLFTFPDNSIDVDFAKGVFELGYKNLTLEYSYADDTLNTGEYSQFFGVKYKHPLSEKWHIDAHAERASGEFFVGFDINDYSNYSIGISGKKADFDLGLHYLYNDIRNSDEKNSGALRNDNTFVFSIAYTVRF